nr:immunoglobulin heavy chain junction region [Macaca mulatta]MOV47908.1 immunoglobulin heavy chain junction region [Macaca mulatta]MOV48158.1 immunoglobulin heavy chain junction region [Macaca mulatta]
CARWASGDFDYW